MLPSLLFQIQSRPTHLSVYRAIELTNERKVNRMKRKRKKERKRRRMIIRREREKNASMVDGWVERMM